MNLITDHGPYTEDPDGTRTPVGFVVLGFHAWDTEYDGGTFDTGRANARLAELVEPYIPGRHLHIADDDDELNVMTRGQGFTDLTPQLGEVMDYIYCNADLWISS